MKQSGFTVGQKVMSIVLNDLNFAVKVEKKTVFWGSRHILIETMHHYADQETTAVTYNLRVD